MNFLDIINRDLSDLRNLQGMREKMYVNSRAIRELVRHYEELDSFHRVTSIDDRGAVLEEKLHNCIKAVYENQGKNAETTLMLIMDTLRPLMERRYKDQQLRMYRI